MTNQIKTQADAQELFQVRGLAQVGQQKYNPDSRRWEYPDTFEPDTAIMTAVGVEHTRKYDSRFKIQEVVSIGKLWPEGTTIELTNSTYRNCYATAAYLVKSPKPLTDEDFDILRTQGAFMSGQETGLVSSSKETPEGWEYVCRSVCDSGD